MKNKIIYILLIIFSAFMYSNFVKAAEVKESLQDVVKDEINLFGSVSGYEEEVNTLKNADLSNYKESDSKTNIYVFRGSTCSHCLDAIVYFAKNIDELGKYYNFVFYETWNNTDNSKLMSKVASTLGKSADGVPFIVVGNTTYAGFSDSIGEQILDKGKELLNASEKYDVFDHLSTPETSKTVVIVLVVLVVLIGVGFIIYVSKSSN